MYKIIILLIVFLIPIFNCLADCNKYISLEGFTESAFENRALFSVLNDYKNLYHENLQLSDLHPTTYKSLKLLAAKFELTEQQNISITAIVIFNNRAQLVSVIENNKIIFCSSEK